MEREVKFTAGADIEMFIEQDGTYLPAHHFTEGTKDEPEALPSGGFISYDNVAIEFGVKPANTEDEFADHILTTIREVSEYLPSDVAVVIVPSAHFHETQLLDSICREAGCDPDYNAWTGKQNIVADDIMDGTLRSCGGHLHIGHPFAQKNPREWIQWMDYLNGMISTRLDNSKASLERRKLYGKAGCYRETEYGAEYRTLSNFWVKDEINIRLQYSLLNDLVNILEYGKTVLPNLSADQVQKVINTGDAKYAQQIVKTHIWGLLSDYTKGLLDKAGYGD